MKNYSIIWSYSFFKEIDSIYYYIYHTLENPIAAKRLHKKIMNKIYSLQFFPERYVKLKSIQNHSLHRLQIDKYVVIYEIYNNIRSSTYFTYLSW